MVVFPSLIITVNKGVKWIDNPQQSSKLVYRVLCKVYVKKIWCIMMNILPLCSIILIIVSSHSLVQKPLNKINHLAVQDIMDFFY